MLENSNNSFELKISILSNEILNFSISVDDFKTKWIILGLISFAGIMGTVSVFGPSIKELFM